MGKSTNTAAATQDGRSLRSNRSREAVDQAASFEAWDRLRTEQRLGRPRAEAVTRRGVLSLVDNL